MILTEEDSEGRSWDFLLLRDGFHAYSTTSSGSWSNMSYRSFLDATSRTFLPAGFPDSVRPEYLAYQFWDSLQALCSYLRSVLTIQAVLTSAGVGNSEASALSTTLTWVIKDGMGMIGSLLFAYRFADVFEVNVKEWRLVADILNNFALTVDLFLPLYPGYYLILTCVSSMCKSCCGLVSGATRARISAHFAQKGHLADVTAKESTQETAVTLIGLIIGFICTKYIGDSSEVAWILFFVLMTIHQIANYKLIRTLVLDTLNPQRVYLMVHYIEVLLQMEGTVITNGSSSKDPVAATVMLTIPTPEIVADNESIYRPIWLYFYGPQHAVSLSTLLKAIHMTPKTLNDAYIALRNAWIGQEFIIAVDSRGRPITCLYKNCNEEGSIKAYAISCYFMHRWSVEKVTSNISKLNYILNGGAIYGLKWYAKQVHNRGLKKFGWDVDDGSTTLGGNGARIVSDGYGCSYSYRESNNNKSR